MNRTYSLRFLPFLSLPLRSLSLRSLPFLSLPLRSLSLRSLPYRSLLSLLVLFFLLATPFFSSSCRLSPPQADPPLSVGPIGITVSNLKRSVDFYTGVLSFEKSYEMERYGRHWEERQNLFGLRIRVARLQLGQEEIELTEYMTPTGRPIAVDSRSNDLWFQHIAIVVRDMEEAYAHLRRHNIAHVSTAPQRIPESNAAAAGIKAFYFKDPDNHVLEVIYFPAGKGDPRWQKEKEKLFLGIDHTAIAVSDTEESADYYGQLLGMKLAGRSLNYGTEQEHLNNVAGARVRITTFKAPAGPGIEFLEYLQPGAGRPYPRDSQSNDLWHWQTTIEIADATKFFNRLKAARSHLEAEKAVQMPDGSKSFLGRDPDHHALLFTEVQ